MFPGGQVLRLQDALVPPFVDEHPVVPADQPVRVTTHAAVVTTVIDGTLRAALEPLSWNRIQLREQQLPNPA